MDQFLPRPEPVVSRRLGPLLERLRWYGGRRVVAVVLSLITASGFAWWALHPSSLPVETRIPVAHHTLPSVAGPTTSALAGPVSTEVSSAAPLMYVDVAGAVRQPGVYRLARGARVVDAVREAGGAEADAELDAVNLAMALDDGVRIYVPRRGEADPMGTSDSATVTVHINTATAQQLDALPGVGPATAAAIVAYRTAHGPFSALDELAAVKGIGPAKLDAIRQMIEL